MKKRSVISPFSIIFLFLLFLCLFFICGFQKQEQRVEQEKHEAVVRLVLIDVIVTKDGQFVKDLTKDDFELYEDGKEVPINSFELIGLEEREIAVLKDQVKVEEVEQEDIQEQKHSRKKLVVIFDGINTWIRDLKVKSDEILDELLSVVKLGNEVMICEIDFNQGLKILQPFTMNEDLIKSSVAAASGRAWDRGMDLGTVAPGDPMSQADMGYTTDLALMGDEFNALVRFEKVIGGILGTINMIKELPGRKSVLFISSGLQSISSIGWRKWGPAISGIFDPFNMLKHKVFLDSGEVIDDIIRVANTHNISFYSITPVVFIKKVSSGATAEYYQQFEQAFQSSMDDSKKTMAQNLRLFSESTGGDSYQGARRFEHFRETMKTDLTYYYELSFYPKRSVADDQYHKITVKVNRPGVDVRHRQGYSDYTEASRNNLRLVTAFYNPTLFNNLPFEAEFTPFYSDSGKFEPWMSIALPTKDIFVDRFVDFSKELFNLYIWIHDNVNKEKGYSGEIRLPFDINQDFMDYVQSIDYLNVHFKGPELKLKQREYRTVFTLVDSETNEIGAWEFVFTLPDLKKSKKGAFINCVLGDVGKKSVKGPEFFALSRKDGCLQYGDMKFSPRVVNTFKRWNGAHVFLQAFLPSVKKQIEPEFMAINEGQKVRTLKSELLAQSLNKNSKVWSGLFFLDLSDASLGDNILYVEIPGFEGGSVLSRELSLTIIGGKSAKELEIKRLSKPIVDKQRVSLDEPKSAAKETISISPSQYSPELEIILKKCGEYCERLAGVVLDIVCTEKIVETLYGGSDVNLSMTKSFKVETMQDQARRSIQFRPRKNIYKYEYDYQLIRKDQKITEQRILMKEDGKDRDVKNAALKTRFVHEYMILGPYGLLSKEWQPYHDYKIVDEKKLWKKKAYVIEAVPKPGFTLDHSWGKIWVSKKDFCILKIEWDQKSIKGIASPPENMQINMATEYKVEKNGIRFPSLYTLEEMYAIPGAKRLKRSTIKVEYKDYKFFTVETEVKYDN